jgi:hypothetical protein
MLVLRAAYGLLRASICAQDVVVYIAKSISKLFFYYNSFDTASNVLFLIFEFIYLFIFPSVFVRLDE